LNTWSCDVLGALAPSGESCGRATESGTQRGVEGAAVRAGLWADVEATSVGGWGWGSTVGASVAVEAVVAAVEVAVVVAGALGSLALDSIVPSTTEDVCTQNTD